MNKDMAKKIDTPTDKLDILSKAFISGKILSIKDIMALVSVNRSRAYDYITILSNRGLPLETKKEGRIAFYFLAEDSTNSCFYKELSNKDIIQYHILMLLRLRPMIAEKLYSELCMLSTIPQSTFYNVINEMLSNKLIIPSTKKEYGHGNNSGRTYEKRYLYPSGIDVPLILNINLDGQNTLKAKVASGQQHGKALISLCQKIAILTGDNETAALNDSTFIQYGRGYHMDSNIQKYYQILIDNQFDKNILSFKYKGKPVKFDTGMVVYSQDKDMLYLLGRKIGTHQTTILKFSEISEITYLKDLNKEYGKPKYNEYLANMFSISTDTPYDVEVHFTYSSTTYQKLYKLTQLRTNAHLKKEGRKLIYTDRISGLSDFANYLRSYGSSFNIIKPARLKDALMTTVNRALSRYQGD